MLLCSGSQGLNILVLAQLLLAATGSLGALIRWTQSDFRRLRGIGPVKAQQLVAVMELAQRVLAADGGVAQVLDRPELVSQHFEGFTAGSPVEKF